MERINISQPKEDLALWRAIAKKKGWTFAYLVFDAINARYGLGRERPGRGRPKSKPVARKRQKRNSGPR
jgi:hypothetical protein